MKAVLVSWDNFRHFVLVSVQSLDRKGSFMQNSGYVFSGKLVVILLTVITSPVLTRLYSPTDYGYFSQFSLIVSNFALLAAAGYPLALTILKDEKDFYSLLALSITITIFSFIILSTAILIFDGLLIPENFPNRGLYQFLLLSGALLFALMYVFPRWNVFKSQFRIGAGINSIVMFSSRSISILIGVFTKWLPVGLIIGEASGKLVGLILNLSINLFPGKKKFFEAFQFQKLLRTAQKYKNYPRFMLLSNYLGGVANQIPLFIFSFLFESRVIGFYALALGVINLPCQLIANSISPVYIKKAIYLRHNEPRQLSIFTKKLSQLIFNITLIPFSLLIVLSPQVFEFAFGKEWEIAGYFGSLLSVLGVFELINISINGIFQIFKKEQLVFNIATLQFLVTILLCSPGIIIHNEFYIVIGFVISRLTIINYSIYQSFKTIGVSSLKMMIYQFMCLAFLVLGLSIIIPF